MLIYLIKSSKGEEEEKKEKEKKKDKKKGWVGGGHSHKQSEGLGGVFYGRIK